MVIKRIFSFIFLLIFILPLIYAVPILPTVISGEVTINNKLAKTGTEISANINGIEIKSIETTKKGTYAIAIPGNKEDEGKLIILNVNGIYAANTTWAPGKVEEINLDIEQPVNYLTYFLWALLIIIIIFLLLFLIKIIKKIKRRRKLKRLKSKR